LVREVAHARKQNPLSDLGQILQNGRYPDVITCATFGEDRLRGLGVAGGQSLPFSIDFDRRPYNTLALPCECVICVKFLCGQGTVIGYTTDGRSCSAGIAPTGNAVDGPGSAEVRRTRFAPDLPIRQRTSRPQVPMMPPPRLHWIQNRAKRDYGSCCLKLDCSMFS